MKKDVVLSTIFEHFKPEFLSLLDDIVVFDALSIEDLTHVLDIQCRRSRRSVTSRPRRTA